MNPSLTFQLVDDCIAVLTMNRPEVRNAIDEDMIEGFEQAVQKINQDNSIKVMVLTGAGPAFCAGGNVKDMQNQRSIFAGTPAQLRDNYQRHIQRIPLALQALKVPSIAAVNGPAYGAGCDISLMCDMRIASQAATFAESFIKLGLIPGDGGAWFLPRVVGRARAAEMSFTGDPIDAQTAAQWGLVNRTVAADDLLPETLTLARRIARNPATALRMSKQLLKESEQQSLASLLEMSAAMQALAHHTEDHQEAVAAFLDKRQPRFTGE